MKHILFVALAWIVLAANAQTITFDTKDYKEIGVYDTWEQSPFRTGKLQGNAQVIANHLNQVDPILEKAPDSTAFIAGLQRSRYGSNTFGLRIDLNEPFRLTKKVRYLHVLIYKPIESRVLVCGLGKRTEEAWSWQDGTCEQFKVASEVKVPANTWVDVVLPINGFSYAEPNKGGIDISSLIICPDLRTPEPDEEDFACYIDQIEINDSPKPRFSTELYAVNFDKDMEAIRTDRYVTAIGLGTQERKGFTTTVYKDQMNDAFSAKPGQTVIPKFKYNGASMSGYVYVDWNNDGKFTYNILANGRPATGSEIVSYSAYNPYKDTGSGPNSWLKSNGTKATDGNTINKPMPPFTVPASTPYGFYRMRYKIDWNCIDPAGNANQGNLLPNNGGTVIDRILDIHPDSIHVTEGSLNGQILTADGKPLDRVYAPYGKDFTIKIDPYPGFSHDGVVIRSGYNTGSNTQFVNENPLYVINSFPYSSFDENGMLTIPANMMIGGEVHIEGQFIEALKTPYTVNVEGNPQGAKGGVVFKGQSYYNGDKIAVDHVLYNDGTLTAIEISDYDGFVLVTDDMNINVTYRAKPIQGDTITSLSQLDNAKAYFITSITGEGTLVYNNAVSIDYVSIKASNGIVQGIANTQYTTDVDPFSLNDSWQILKKDNRYFLYNPGVKAFVTLADRDYVFTDEETPLKQIRTNKATETTTVNGKNLSLKGSFSFLGKDGDNNHYACICTGNTPQALRNWTYNDHGSVFYIIENPNVSVTDIFDPSGIDDLIGYTPQENQTVYDLNGRTLPTIPDKGVYILNRRKYIRK